MATLQELQNAKLVTIDNLSAVKTYIDNNKVDKVTGKGLSTNDFTNDYKSAIDNLPDSYARTDATKVEKSTTNGNIKINGTETTVYTHPSGTNPHGTTKSDIGLGNVGNFKAVSTVANQGLSDTEKSNARANIGAGTSSFSGSYNDLTNKPTIPTVGNGTITITQNGTTKGTFTTNQSGNTTIALTDNDTTYGVATQTTNGLESAADKKKLDGIATGAEVNQNAFSNVVVGSTTISADSKTDSLTLAGSNVTITPDATNDKVTIGITKANVTSALGYTPPTTNTTYGVATSSALGLVKSGTDITVDNSGNVSINDDSHNHVISNVDGLQSALDGKLDKITPGGIASCSGNGKYNYLKIATIKITSDYINRPIVFEMSGRGKGLSLITIEFSSENNTDPTLSFFTSNCDNCFWIKKTTTSTWEVYGKYNELWGHYTIHRITGCGADIGVTVNMTNIDSLPSGCTQVAYGGNVNYANSASSATKATQDESGNNIKSSYASSISISDHTITLKNKNGASLGTVTVPDNNTKNTAGSTNTSSKIFLVGATSQASNPQTYSHDTAYVGTDGCLYSNSKKVSVEGHTHEAISEDFIRGLFA